MAQKYNSDDGQYVADVQLVHQYLSQTEKGGIVFLTVLYVHRLDDRTPASKVSRLRSDRLVCATLDNVTVENGELPTASYTDAYSAEVIGQEATVIVGREIGQVRKSIRSIDLTVYIADSAGWQYSRRIIPRGASTADFGPLSYRITATPGEVNLNEGGAHTYLPDVSAPDIRQMWPKSIYDDGTILVTDAKGRSLYETGGGAFTDGGNILERMTYYSAHENWFTPTIELPDKRVVTLQQCNGPHGSTIQIPLGYSTINYSITLSMPMAQTWILKAEHFYLTNIPLPPVTHD